MEYKQVNNSAERLRLCRHMRIALAEILKEIREEAGYSVRGLSKELGLTAQTIYLKEKGRHMISTDDILLYTTMFGALPSDIVKQAEKRALKKDL